MTKQLHNTRNIIKHYKYCIYELVNILNMLIKNFKETDFVMGIHLNLFNIKDV